MTSIDRAAAIAELYRATFTSGQVADRHRIGVKDRVAVCIKTGSEKGLEMEHVAAYALLGEVESGVFSK